MANFEIDMKGTRELYHWIEQFDKKFDSFLEDLLLQAALKALRLTKKRTPVNNRSIYIGIGEERKEITISGGTLRRSWKITDVKRSGDNLMITLYADSTIAPYAPYVEYGHRQKPGRFVPAIGKRLKKPFVPGLKMATTSIKEVEKQLPAAYKAAFAKFVNGLINS